MKNRKFIEIKIMLLAAFVLLMSSCATLSKKEADLFVKPVKKAEAPGKPTLVTMPVGDVNLKGQYLEIEPGDIYQASSDKMKSFESMIDELAGKKVIFLGENHVSMNMHNSQDMIIRALYKRNPNITIGMEFFKRGDNEVLKNWSAGRLTEEQLIYQTGWYNSVGFNFGYYRAIMNFARDKGLVVEGMNIPRTVLRNVSRMGLDNLSEYEKEMVGQVVVDHKEHKKLIMKYFGDTMMAHGNNRMMQVMMEKRYTAQCVWDNVFADSILKKAVDSDGIYVVIVGSGHIAYKLGANRRLKEKTDIAQASLFPIEVEKDAKSRVVSRAIGDYILGFNSDSERPFYPDLSVGAYDYNNRIHVGRIYPGSPLMKAGFKKGDKILELDGIKLRDFTHMKILLSKKKWGDKAVYKLSREGKEFEIVLKSN